MPVVGQNMMLFIAHGYGFVVIVGYVAARLDGMGWRIERARFIDNTNNLDNWQRIAAGHDREAVTWSEQQEWLNVGPVSLSLPWKGDLP